MGCAYQVTCARTCVQAVEIIVEIGCVQVDSKLAERSNVDAESGCTDNGECAITGINGVQITRVIDGKQLSTRARN